MPAFGFDYVVEFAHYAAGEAKMLLYGTFEDKGYKFDAYIPNSDAEPVAFELRVQTGDEVKRAILVPMTYTPTFGVDAGDRQYLEAILDRVLGLLPDSKNFSTKDSQALDDLEKEIGGDLVRERHAEWMNSEHRPRGQFDYTAGLFADRFADVLGGREQMDRWMKTELAQLGDRTPEEALRLGMSQEVINCLINIDHQGSGHTCDSKP